MRDLSMNSKYAINILQSSATITRLLEVFFVEYYSTKHYNTGRSELLTLARYMSVFLLNYLYYVDNPFRRNS